MIAKRIAFLLACVGLSYARADAFFWINSVDQRWLPFETLSNWNVGTSATGTVPTRYPGEADTIDYGSYPNYVFLYFNLGGHAHTVAGFTNTSADWKTHYLGISNGTLTVTGDYQPRSFYTTIAKGGRLNIHGDSATDSLWGGSGIMCPYTVLDGGHLEMGGAYAIYGSAIQNDAGGTVDFTISQLGWYGYSEFKNGITNNGTLNIPNGLTVTTPSMTELWNSSSGGYRKPTFGIIQRAGTLTLGGDLKRVRKCDEGYCPFDFGVYGGKTVFDCTPTFSNVDPVLGNGVALEIEVTEGNTVNLGLFAGGAGSQITKTGAGYLKSKADAPYVLIVKEGGYITSSATDPIPESVTLDDGATLVFGVDGTTLTTAQFPSYENYTYDIDTDGIPDGGTVLTTPDSLLRNGVFARLKVRPGVTYAIDGMRITYAARKKAGTFHWTGAAGDGKWTTPGNWDGDVPGELANGGYPDDVAVFSDGSTIDQTIDLSGLISVSNVIVRGSAAPSYTFGTSADQVLRLAAGGSFTIESDVENMPILAATLGFKSKATASEGVYTVCNETARDFTVNDVGSVLCTWTTENVDTLRLTGAGTIRLAGQSRDMGVHSLNLCESLSYNPSAKTGRLVIDADESVNSLAVTDGSADLHKIEISAGRTLSLDGGAASLAKISRDLLISGSGTLQLSSGLSSGSYVNGAFAIDSGCTVTIETKLKSACVTTVSGTFKSGAQFTGSGAVVLPSDTAIEGTIEALNGVQVRASSIGFSGTQSALGLGDTVSLGSTGSLVYTGTGETAGRSFSLASDEGRVCQGGSGVLTISSSPVSSAANTTLGLYNLAGSDGVWYDGVWAAAIKNNTQKLNLLKGGPGRWILTGANAFSGTTTVDTGTLKLRDAGTLTSSSGVTIQNGGTLEFDGTGSETIRSLTIGAGENRIVVTNTATLTIRSITRGTGDGTLDIITGSSANYVTLYGKTASSDRLNWIRINGRAAGFDNTGKIIASLLNLNTQIAARGGVIPNASTKNVGITTDGTTGHVTLQNSTSATVKGLAQEASVTAQVEIPSGQKFTTAGLYAEADKAPLVIGGFTSDGSLYSSATEFTLYPEGTNSEIRILAPFGFTSSTILHQYGKGLTRLASSGAATWAGTVQVDSGTFAMSNTTALAATLKGPGRFKLEGPNTRTLSKAQTSFNGDFVLGGGTTKPALNTAFGNVNNSTLLPQIVVEKGATLDLTGSMPTATKTVNYNFRGFRLSGDGVDGKGAIVSTVGNKTTQAHSLSLDADASIGEINQTGGSCYIHFRNPSSAYNSLSDFGGHTLTHTATGLFSFAWNTITNAGSIILGGTGIAEGKSGMILYDNVELGEPSDPPVVMRDGSAIYMGTGFKPGSAPFMRTLSVEGANALLSSWAAGCNTNRNCWGGPIVLKNSTSLLKCTPSNPNNDLQIALHGLISGPGSVSFGSRGRVFVTHPHNTWTGTTTINSTYGMGAHFDFPGSLPNYAKTLLQSGHATVYTDGDAGSHWKRADILSLANKATLSQNDANVAFGTVTIDATGCKNKTYELTLADGDMTNPTFGLGVDGGKVVLDGDFTHIHHLHANRGTLAVSGNRERTLEAMTFATSDGTNEMGVISFEGGSTTTIGTGICVGHQNWTLNAIGKVTVTNATLLSDKFNETNAASYVNLAYRDNTGILEVNDGAVVSNRLILSQSSSNGGRGAVHVHGGTLTSWGSAKYPTVMAGTQASYGFIGVDGGAFVQSGPMQVASVASSTTKAQGVFYQTGGTFRYVTRDLGTDIADDAWRLGGPTGTAILFCRLGGDFTAERSIRLAHPGPSASTVYSGGTATWIQGPDAGTTEIEKSFILAGANSSVANLTLVGGTLIANKFIKAGKTANKAYVGFNGGTLLTKSSNPIFGTVSDEASTPADKLTVYSGGAHIGATAGVTATLGQSLQKATGTGIVAISNPDWEKIVPTNSCGRMAGPPTVTITDSTGVGATAYVEFDYASLMPGAIVVTCPGTGYTKPTVTLTYAKNTWTCTATLAANETDGGLACEGEGTLVLDRANDYAGPTTVNGGTLRPTVSSAIPSASTVVLNGGIFDINGMDIGTSRITFNAGGGLMNSNGTIPVHTSFTADMQAIREGKVFNYYGDVSFAENTLVTIINASVEDFSSSAPSSYTIFRVTGEVAGVENLTVSVEGLAEETANWKVTHAGEEIKIRCSRGNFILMY